jgi:hypothetical protein
MMSDVAVFIMVNYGICRLKNIEVQYHSRLNHTFEQSTRYDLAMEVTSHVHGKVNRYIVSLNGDEKTSLEHGLVERSPFIGPSVT